MPVSTDAWLESSDVVPMFPTLVWKLRLKPAYHRPMDERILAALEKQGLPELKPGEAWQSAQNLHELEEFLDLAACIRRAAQSVLHFLRIGNTSFQITGCWTNVLAKGASHRSHSHPNNFLSAVYYLRAPAGSDTINFHDPRSQTGIIRPPVTELTAENTDQVVVPVQPGNLLLFPSYFQHSVDANASDELRISVSFNFMFSDFAENLSKPLW